MKSKDVAETKVEMAAQTPEKKTVLEKQTQVKQKTAIQLKETPTEKKSQVEAETATHSKESLSERKTQIKHKTQIKQKTAILLKESLAEKKTQLTQKTAISSKESMPEKKSLLDQKTAVQSKETQAEKETPLKQKSAVLSKETSKELETQQKSTEDLLTRPGAAEEMEQIKTLKDLRTREIAEQKAAEALGLASTRTYEADSLELTYGGFGKRNKKDAVIKMDRDFEMSLANLEKEEWYHGCLPYEDIVGLLKADGDFLVRGLDAQGDRNAMACVTVKYKGKVMDFPVHYVHHKHSHMYTIDGQNKQATIMGIVMFHYNSRTPISKKITLLHPVAKAKWELTKDKITLVKKVGEGEYGEVWQGKLHEGPKTNIIVAVKMTKVVDENQAMVREMYEEARLMRQYKHKNVVAFYGVVQESLDNAMIVMEFIGGCLRDYIRRNKDHMSVKKKIHYASDIAVGLVYLHTKGCMHRDIACRNCLIDEKKQVVKISDFGMSKVADVYNIPKTEKIPIRWQAPEAVLLRIYTAKSDVFSYGITLWEIFHDAETPYKGIDNKTIRLKILNPTFRPQVNPNVPIVAVRVMKACWRANPKRRPTMAQAARYLIHSPKQLLEPKQSEDSRKKKHGKKSEHEHRRGSDKKSRKTNSTSSMLGRRLLQLKEKLGITQEE